MSSVAVCSVGSSEEWAKPYDLGREAFGRGEWPRRDLMISWEAFGDGAPFSRNYVNGWQQGLVSFSHGLCSVLAPMQAAETPRYGPGKVAEFAHALIVAWSKEQGYREQGKATATAWGYDQYGAAPKYSPPAYQRAHLIGHPESPQPAARFGPLSDATTLEDGRLTFARGACRYELVPGELATKLMNAKTSSGAVKAKRADAKVDPVLRQTIQQGKAARAAKAVAAPAPEPRADTVGVVVELAEVREPLPSALVASARVTTERIDKVRDVAVVDRLGIPTRIVEWLAALIYEPKREYATAYVHYLLEGGAEPAEPATLRDDSKWPAKVRAQCEHKVAAHRKS